MGKLDTKGIEFLEGAADPFSRVVRTRQSVKVPLVSKRKAVKKVSGLNRMLLTDMSSAALVGELLRRHYVDLQALGFWIALAVIVWIKLG